MFMDWKISAHPGDLTFLDGTVVLRSVQGSSKHGHFEFARMSLSLHEVGFPPGSELRLSSISVYGGTIEAHERLAVPDSEQGKILAPQELRKKAKALLGVERLTFEDVRVYFLSTFGNAQIGIRSLDVADPGSSHSSFSADLTFSGATKDYRFVICPVRIGGFFLGRDRAHLNVRTEQWEIYAFERKLTLPAFRSEILVEDIARDGFTFQSETLTADEARIFGPALSCENLSGSYSGKASWKNGEISAAAELNCSAKVLRCLGERFVGPFAANAKASAKLQPATGRVSLESLKAQCDLGWGNRIMFSTEGQIAFVRKNGAYSFEPTDAKLKAHTSAPFDLTPYDRILPFPAKGLDLDLLYQVELMPEAPKLRGYAAGGITDSRTHLKIFDFDSRFSSDEISGIRDFKVTDCRVDLFSKQEELLHLDLAGKYDVATADLSGGIRYKLYDAVRALGPKYDRVAELLERAGLHQTRYNADVQLHFDFPSTLLSANVSSRVTHLPFRDRNGQEIPFDLNGFALFRVAPSGERFHLETVFRAQAENHFDFMLDLSSGSSRQVRGLMVVDRLDPMLAEQLLSRLLQSESYPQEAGFTNASMRMSFACDPMTLEAEILELNAALEDDQGAALTFSNASAPIPISRGNPFPESASFALSAQGLSLRNLGRLLPSNPDFCLVDGWIDGDWKIDLSERCRKADFYGKTQGSDLSFLANGSMYSIHRAAMNGRLSFEVPSRTASLSDVCVDLFDDQEQEMLFVCANGTALLKDDFRVELALSGIRFGPNVVSICDAVPKDFLHLEQLSTDGVLRYAARNRFAAQSLNGNLALRRIRFLAPDGSGEAMPLLSGNASLDLLCAGSSMAGSADLRLSDSAGKPRFHLQYFQPPDAGVPPLIRSSALDLRMLALLPWTSLPKVDFPEFTLRLALNRLFWGDSPIEFSFCGPARFAGSNVSMPEMQLDGFLKGTASLDLDFLPAGELGFSLKTELRDLALQQLIQTFGTDREDNRLSGTCSELSLQAAGAGFTEEAVRKSWTSDIRGTLNDVRFRNSIREDFVAVNLVFLPLSVLPTLFDLVPFDLVRRPLVALVGGEYTKILAGTKDVEFTQGVFDLSLRNGKLDVNRLELSGPLFDSYTAKGSAELLSGTVDLRFMVELAGLCWPVVLSGSCANPDVEYAMFLPLFLKENSMRAYMLMPWTDDEDADAPKAPESPEAPETPEARGDGKTETGSSLLPF